MAIAEDIFKVRHPEDQTEHQDASHRTSSEVTQTTGTTSSAANQRAANAADSAALVHSHQLPDLQIDGADTSHETRDKPPGPPHDDEVMHFFGNVGKVLGDVATGFVNEIKDHPDHVLEMAAVGLAVGVAATVLLPETAVAAVGGVALAAAGVDLGIHLPGWAHDADVVTNTNHYSAAEVAQAHGDLQNAGAHGALLVAGTLGGLAAGPVTGIAKGLFTGGTAAETSAGDSAVMGTLNDAVASGRYEIRDVGGVSVYMPKAPIVADAPGTSVMDVLGDAVASGRYEVRDVGGVSVLAPTAANAPGRTVMDILGDAVASGRYKAVPDINGITSYVPTGA